MPTTPMEPTSASTSSHRSRTPPTSSTPNRMGTNTMKVPKSGWSRIRPQTTAHAASPAAS
jgi:hypothetical protein